MIVALSDPIEVRIVGEGSELIGPLVIAGAAIFAAFVAAYWQRQQLQHDRWVRDRERALTTIDAIVETIPKTSYLMAKFAVGDGPEEQVFADAEASMSEIISNSFRLGVVVRSDTAVSIRYDEMRSAFGLWFDSIKKVSEDRDDKERKAAERVAFRSTRDAIKEFESACYDWFAESSPKPGLLARWFRRMLSR